MVKVIEKALKEAASGGAPVPSTLFELAEKEVRETATKWPRNGRRSHAHCACRVRRAHRAVFKRYVGPSQAQAQAQAQTQASPLDQVFQLMDRNAYHRFRADPDAVRAVCEEFFAKADLEQVATDVSRDVFT